MTTSQLLLDVSSNGQCHRHNQHRQGTVSDGEMSMPAGWGRRALNRPFLGGAHHCRAPENILGKHNAASRDDTGPLPVGRHRVVGPGGICADGAKPRSRAECCFKGRYRDSPSAVRAQRLPPNLVIR